HIFPCVSTKNIVFYTPRASAVTAHHHEVNFLGPRRLRDLHEWRSFQDHPAHCHTRRLLRFEQATRVQPGMMSKALLLCRRIRWNSQEAKPVEGVERTGVDHVEKQDIGLRYLSQ